MSDLLILQFPLWWFSVPAIMKGWIDRVLANGTRVTGRPWSAGPSVWRWQYTVVPAAVANGSGSTDRQMSIA